MEVIAYIHNAVAYENPASAEPKSVSQLNQSLNWRQVSRSIHSASYSASSSVYPVSINRKRSLLAMHPVSG